MYIPLSGFPKRQGLFFWFRIYVTSYVVLRNPLMYLVQRSSLSILHQYVILGFVEILAASEQASQLEEVF